MFKKNKNQQKPKQDDKSNSPKWTHPKILLVDMEKKAETLLLEEGYAVSAGSFGIPYICPKDDKLLPVITQGAKLPNYAEQEIIVIDLFPPDATASVTEDKHTTKGEDDWWASCSEGVIPKLNPRLRRGE